MSEQEKIFLTAQEKSEESILHLKSFLEQHNKVMQEYFALLEKHVDAENEKFKALNKIQK